MLRQRSSGGQLLTFTANLGGEIKIISSQYQSLILKTYRPYHERKLDFLANFCYIVRATGVCMSFPHAPRLGLSTPSDSANPDIDKCEKHGSPLTSGFCMHCLDGVDLGLWTPPTADIGNATVRPGSRPMMIGSPFEQSGSPYFYHGAGPQPTAIEEGDRATS